MPPNNRPPSPAPAPAPQNDMFVEIVSLLFVVMVIMGLITNVVANLNNSKILARGWAGLTPRGILLSHTSPISSFANPIGLPVISVYDTDVLNAPAGKKIGTQSTTARGKIIQGPVDVGGTRYWYVDYDNGPDGWVKEGDIAHLDSEPSKFEWAIISLLFVYPYLRLFLIILSILLVMAVVYLFRRLTEMRVNEDKLLYPKSQAIVSAVNPKWEIIQSHIESANENDWKQAIMEADILLGDILDRLSLPGDTIGDKLKAVEKSDFTTVDLAWEGHKVRNQIAHEGSSFLLNQREAKRVIGLYQKVFEEFHII